MISQEYLKSLIYYDAESGIFTWLKGTRKGKQAGCSDSYGYIRIVIDQKFYKAHRLAWLYVHGNFPKIEIDHKNGIRDDNRIINLRDGSRTCNTQNQIVQRKNSKHKYRGVTIKNGKWWAKIVANKKQIDLGLYDSEEDAHKAYIQGKIKYHEFYIYNE